jgi:hypothetical protein
MIRPDLFPLGSISPELIEATLARPSVPLSGDEWQSFQSDGRLLEPAEARGMVRRQ